MIKIIFIVLAMILTNNSYCQIHSDSISGVQLTGRKLYKENDTIPKVIYLNEDKFQNNSAIYLNGRVVEEQVLKTINPDLIKDIKVRKKSGETNDNNYNGSIIITLNQDYTPKWISLNELQAKYVENLKTSTLFMLNEESINGDYDKYLVDENYILKIEVKKIYNEKEKLNLNIVKLITRTKENLKKANTIYIRGET